MAKKDFDIFSGDAKKKAAELAATRDAFNGRIGEVITAFIGNDTLQKMFENSQVPEDMKNLASGEIALRMGLISPAAKTALLVAQSAERALRAADKAEEYAKTRGTIIMDLYEIPYAIMDRAAAGVIEYNDPVFKFVGSEKDPEILKKVQGTWMTAQLYLNNEVDSINDELMSKPIRKRSLGANYAEGLRREAAGFYLEAAIALQAEGYADAAKKLANVAQFVVATLSGNATATSPKQLAQHLLNNVQNSAETDEAYKAALTKLVNICPDNNNAAPARVPPAPPLMPS